jgi:NitT/TauT family transport system permease protein
MEIAMSRLKPLLPLVILILVWQLAAGRLIPTPIAVAHSLGGLLASGALIKHIVASVFRITWGFLLASIVAIPCGMALALHRRWRLTVNPLLALLRPLSPLAWTPLAVLWFGVGDSPAIFLIFIACAPTLALIAMAAVRSIKPAYLNAGRNFGLSNVQLLRRVIFPAAAPQILAGMRTTLAVAWSVLISGEMLSVNSGLGFLIMDARNAGNRFDLVFAGMLAIGAVGFGIDAAMRLAERTEMMRWAQVK